MTARSDVLLVGDSGDDHHLAIAQNHQLGADGAFVFERFEHDTLPLEWVGEDGGRARPSQLTAGARSSTWRCGGFLRQSDLFGIIRRALGLE